jgi:hypothetical protein
MMEMPKHSLFLFPSVGHAMKAEKILQEQGIAHKLIPIPREISLDCGVCLRVEADLCDAAAAALEGRVEWERTVLL